MDAKAACYLRGMAAQGAKRGSGPGLTTDQIESRQGHGLQGQEAENMLRYSKVGGLTADPPALTRFLTHTGV
eukprot:1146841-Pelagomonas_calceolata.AAC.3